MLSEYPTRLLKKIAKRKKLVFTVVFVIVSCVTFLHTDWSPDLYFITLNSFENVSCYVSNFGDGLSQINDEFVPPAKSIYFHETSCRGGLNSRQACAVESAAKTHPHWQINVFFTGPVSQEQFHIGSMNALKKYDNIKFLRLNLVQYAKGTPLEKMVGSGALNRTRWRISHTSDALRYLSLYKWGGIYLDLDMVVVRPLDDLAPNWAARETDESVASGAISFTEDQLGRAFADVAIRDFENNFRGDVWGQNGPGVMTRILKKLCATNDPTKMSQSTCQGLEVYGPEVFYPISWMNARDYFEEKEVNVGHPHTYHVWNKLTESMAVKKQSFYAQLARKYCPEIYETYGDNFGL